jgi:hypothetical protein
MASASPSNPSNMTEEERKRLTCPLCRNTFPNQEYYDSHQIIEASQIANMIEEGLPNFVDTMAKIEDKKREVRDIGRQIEFIAEQQKHEAAFREEQLQREVEFRKGIEQRELRKKRITEELTSIYADGQTPDTIGLFRSLSSENF